MNTRLCGAFKFRTASLLSAGSLALLLSCVSASSDSSASNGAPSWYTDKDKSYPNRDYLAVSGKGSTEREAKRDAAGELATQFSAKIDYDSTASLHYAESGDNASTARGIDQTVRVRSDQEIAGIEYSQAFRAGSQVYIVAYLEREKVGKLYSERIAERRDKIAELRRRAAALNPADKNTEDLLAGFILYDYSVDQALRNQILLEQLQIINKAMHDRVDATIDYDSVQLAAERAKFASRLSFDVNYNEKNELAFLGENIASKLTQLGFPRKKNGDSALLVDFELQLADVQTNNRYQNIAWDLQIRFTRMQNVDGSGAQTSLLEFSKSGRESGITRSRALTTLKRLLSEEIENQFMSQLYEHFAKFAGL